MNLFRNPEFRRNLQMELSVDRIVRLLVVLLAFYVFTWAFSATKTEFLEAACLVSLYAFAVIPGFWGASLVAKSLSGKVHNRTWEFQRMTGISPGEMTQGKLFGGPVYAWLGGLAISAVYFTAALLLGKAAFGLWAWTNLLLLVFFFHGLALVFTLRAMANARFYHGRIAPSGFWAEVVSLALFLLGPAMIYILVKEPVALRWYGISYENPLFQSGSLAFFAFWSVLGAFRCMRREWWIHDVPWAWAAFVVSAMAYLAGFMDHAHDWKNAAEMIPYRFALAGVLGVMAYYGVILSECKDIDPFEVRRLARALQERDPRKFSSSFPLWGISVILTGAICLFTLVFPLPAFPRTFGLLVYLFLWRDLGMILFLKRNFFVVKKQEIEKKVEVDSGIGSALGVLFLFYLIPLFGIGLFRFSGAFPWFFPVVDANGDIHLQYVTLQIILVAGLLARQAQERAMRE
jgi:hypothetical protein